MLDWITDLARPWHRSAIPRSLALPVIDCEAFRAGQMGRHASLSSSCGLLFGVFALLGEEEARRAARAWRPRTRLIMEEVSLAFHLVEEQRLIGEIVSRVNVKRLVATLDAYFASAGRRRSPTEVRRLVDLYLAEHSLPSAEIVSQVRRQIGVRLPLLSDLHLIDDEVSARFKGMHNRPASLGEIGLILDKQLDDSRYKHCTPLNCRTFANTGGDGAHFSLLVQDDAITETSPVVVTAPEASGMPSIVIAASLFDFLCLGSEKGYFGLGHVSHNCNNTLTEYVGPEGALPASEYLLEPYHYEIRDYFCRRLGLRPWVNIEPFIELQSLFAPRLQYPPGALF